MLIRGMRSGVGFEFTSSVTLMKKEAMAMRTLGCCVCVLVLAVVLVSIASANPGGAMKSSPLYKASLEQSIARIEGKAQKSAVADPNGDRSTGKQICPNEPLTWQSTCVPSACEGETCSTSCGGTCSDSCMNTCAQTVCTPPTCYQSCNGTCSGETCLGTCTGSCSTTCSKDTSCVP